MSKKKAFDFAFVGLVLGVAVSFLLSLTVLQIWKLGEAQLVEGGLVRLIAVCLSCALLGAWLGWRQKELPPDDPQRKDLP